MVHFDEGNFRQTLQNGISGTKYHYHTSSHQPRESHHSREVHGVCRKT